MENVKRNLWGLRIEWMLPSCSAWWDVVKPCKQRTRLGGHLIRNLRLGKALRSTWVGSAVQCCFLGVGISALSWGLKRRVTWADSHQSSWRLGGVTSRPNLDGRSHEEEHKYHKFGDGGKTWRYLCGRQQQHFDDVVSGQDLFVVVLSDRNYWLDIDFRCCIQNIEMTSTSHVSLLSTSLLLVVNLSTLTQGWRWPSASQTV